MESGTAPGAIGAAVAGPASSGRWLATGSLYATLALVAAATVAAAVAAAVSGNPLVAIAPIALVAFGYWAARVPLRRPAALLLVLLLVPDAYLVTVGQWHTPLAFLGDLLHFGMLRSQGEPTGLTGSEAIVLFLLAVHVRRRLQGSQVDGAAQAAAARVLGVFLALLAGGVLVAEVIGLARGLPPAMWKVRTLLLPLPFIVVFLSAFRGDRDHELVGRIVVAAALYRAVLAFVVQRLAVMETGGPYVYATSHGDSVLFSVGLFLVLADFAVRPSRRRAIRALLLCPVILLGAIENGRRTFWVMAPLTLAVAYALAPMRGWKRSLTRAVVLVGPIVAIYVAVGWDRTGSFFGPVTTLRSILDPSVSRSSYWREVENWNIAMSMRATALTGAGMGGQYTEIMPNDDISMFYKEYREWPHNSVLGLLFLMGPLGFTSYAALLALVCFLSFRSYWLATAPQHRVAAFGCLAAAIACLVMAYSDIGPNSPQYRVHLALAVAVSARLAVATGAWPPDRLPFRRGVARSLIGSLRLGRWVPSRR